MIGSMSIVIKMAEKGDDDSETYNWMMPIPKNAQSVKQLLKRMVAHCLP